MSIPDVLSPVPGQIPPLTDPVPLPMPQPEDPQIQNVQQRIDFSRISQPFRVMGEHIKNGQEAIVTFIAWRLFVIREIFLRIIFKPSINPHDRSFIKLVDSFATKKTSLERQLAEIQNLFMNRAAVRGDLNRLVYLKTNIEETLTQLRMFTAVTANWQPELPIHARMMEIQAEYDQLYLQFYDYMTNFAPRILSEFHGIAAPFLQTSIPLPPSIRDDLYSIWKVVELHVIPFIQPGIISPSFYSLIDDLLRAYNRPDGGISPLECERPLSLRNSNNSCYIDSTLHMLFSQDSVRERLLKHDLDERITRLEGELLDPTLPPETVRYKTRELAEEKQSLVYRKQLQQELCKLMHGGEYVPQDPISYLDYFLALSAGPSVSKVRKILVDGQFNNLEFNAASMRRQLDAAAFLDVLMREVLDYPFSIQKIACTPAMPGLFFPSPKETLYGLQLALHRGVRDLNELIARNMGEERVNEPNVNYQRLFNPQDGIVLDAEAVVDGVQPMRVQEYSVWHRLQSLQDVMTIQVKRFEGSLTRLPIKNDDEIDLPADGIVDFTPFYDAPIEGDRGARYEIRGMVIHQGGLHSGHYVACVKQGDDYWSCDDMGGYTGVRKITREEFFANKKPYLLILQRI